MLKLGGTLLLVNEVYESDKFQDRNSKWAVWVDMHLHSPAGYREFLTTAGYGAIEVHEVLEKNWITTVSKKTKLPS